MDSAWQPVPQPPGEFRKYQQPSNPERYPEKEVHPVGKVIARLMMGSIGWLMLGGLALLSAIPYGGGSKPLFDLWHLSGIALIVWALMPLTRLFKSKR